jgi:hypothetical protein
VYIQSLTWWQEDNTILASSAIYFIALKTLEQVYKNFVPEELLASTISRISGDVVRKIFWAVGREVLATWLRTFSKILSEFE